MAKVKARKKRAAPSKSKSASVKKRQSTVGAAPVKPAPPLRTIADLVDPSHPKTPNIRIFSVPPGSTTDARSKPEAIYSPSDPSHPKTPP